MTTESFTKNLFCSIGSESTSLSEEDVRRTIYSFLDHVKAREDVLIVPPDFTRYHSRSGLLTQIVCEYYKFTKTSNMNDGDNRIRESENVNDSNQRACLDSLKEERVASAGATNSAEILLDSALNSANPKVSMTSVPTKIEILPSLGTHAPMTSDEIRIMFGNALADMDPSPFRVHDWRNDVVTVGYVPADMVANATNGMITNRPWPAQLNKLVWEKRKSNQNSPETTKTTAHTTAPDSDDGDLEKASPSQEQQTNQVLNSQKQQQQHDPHVPLVLSIGQVVPHEVMGMANYNKNLFVGTGGTDAINVSHFIGAVIGMEKLMGRTMNPLRDILNHASETFIQNELDLWYILTVIGPTEGDNNALAIRGLFIGRDVECYKRACELSLRVNFTLLEKPVSRMVTYLDPSEYHSTWLGNKAIYRTRMAMADRGELIILAPGVRKFGEDPTIDQLIRKYGYVGTPALMKLLEENDELKHNLSAVAHLIHGSSEGRFSVTYCPGHLSKEEIETAGFQYGNLNDMQCRYNVHSLNDGWNLDNDGTEFYFVKNPGLGLWATKTRFDETS